MKIRPYLNSDMEAVVACFNRSVREIGARYYSSGQIDAWAPESPDWEAWVSRLETGGVFVAELHGALAGFVRIEDDGFVDLLYVCPRYERRGVGRALMLVAQAWAAGRGASRLESEVSIAARPLFEAMGFQVESVQTVERRGVRFRNYRMVRDVDAE